MLQKKGTKEKENPDTQAVQRYNNPNKKLGKKMKEPKKAGFLTNGTIRESNNVISTH